MWDFQVTTEHEGVVMHHGYFWNTEDALDVAMDLADRGLDYVHIHLDRFGIVMQCFNGSIWTRKDLDTGEWEVIAQEDI